MSTTQQLISRFTIQHWLTIVGFVVVVIGWWIVHRLTRLREGEARFLRVEKPKDVDIDELRKVEDMHHWYEQYVASHDLSEEQQFNLREFLDVFEQVEALRNPVSARFYNAALIRLQCLICKVVGETPFYVYRPNKDMPLIRRNFFSSDSYHFCLMLAFIYPVFFSLVSWLCSNELVIGGLPLLGKLDGLQRIVVVFGIVVTFTYGQLARIVQLGRWRSQKDRAYLVMLWAALGPILLYKMLGEGTVAFLVGCAAFASLNFIFSLVIVGVVVTINACSSTYAETTDGKVLTAVLLLVVFHLSVELYRIWVDKFNKNWLFLNLFALVYTGIVLLVMVEYGDKAKSYLLLLPIFIGLFPFINAALDWLSLNITRSFLYHIQQNRENFVQAILTSVLDLLLALFFMLTVSALLALIVGSVNGLSQTWTGNQILDISGIMKALTLPEKRAETLWLHLMILSTLVPTILHFLFALYALVFWPLMSKHRNHIDTFWSSQKSKRIVYARQNTAWIVSTGIFVALGAVLYLYAEHMKFIFTGLWSVADGILSAVDPSYHTPV